jgi:hypothetical protein
MLFLLLVFRADMFVDEFYDVFGGGSGKEYFGDAFGFEV